MSGCIELLSSEDAKKYAGKYVVTEGFQSKKVIAFGETIKQAYDLANERGSIAPVTFYVPRPDGTFIF